MVSAELLKKANENFMLIFTKLCNKLLHSGKFPEEWSVGIIVVLFKGGDEADVNNYRELRYYVFLENFSLVFYLKG